MRVIAVDGFEPLLAECLERYGAEGMEAVERLLREHPPEAERVRARLAELARLGLLGEEREARAPDAFGPYKVLRRLGQGGMGTVWLVEDPRRGRRVALKAAQVALDDEGRVRARFEREVRAFAQLSHPCIVPILDVGEAHGRPYFTMEHVAGATLARVIEELRRGGVAPESLDGEDVLRIVLAELESDPDSAHEGERSFRRGYVETVCRLVLDVADGLAHAHAHGVVHRDVKPANVLVRLDGRAQLVDLGLAHLDDQPTLTRSGDLAGTPAYFSPEQARGERAAVGERSDVFSLGVTLFELLTLERPFAGRTTAEVLDAIRRREPPRPRNRNPAIPPDLETICLAALEKDPARRYASMAAFAADLRRFLSFERVRARPIGRLRRGARAMLRNPAPSLALALAALVLGGLPLGLLWANARVRAQRDLARQAADAAEREARLKARVTDFLVELYAQREDPATGREPSAREFLERGARRVERDFGDEPLVRAALMEALGRAYANLGLRAEALPLLDRAFALRQRELGEMHPEVAGVLATLAAVHRAEGHADVALALARRALAALESDPGAPSEAALAARITLAEAAGELGEPALAEEELERALRLRVELDGSDAAGAAELEERLARLALARGAEELALARLERALALRESALAPDPFALARTLEELAALRSARGEQALAEQATQRSLALARRLARSAESVPPAPDELTLADLRPLWHAEHQESFQRGITALQAGRHREASRAFERCLALDPADAVSAYNAACAHALAGEVDLGIAAVERALGLGFADSPGRLEVARKDADVARLREDPRWPALLERMRARQAELAASWHEPLVREPSSAVPRGGRALLVVLHDAGGTSEDVLERWSALAERHGALLCAPSAPPSAGGARAWFTDLDELAQRPLAREERLLASLAELCRRYAVDARAVVVAGEGAAAPLAFDLAVRAPGLLRGVLLVDGPPLPTVGEERTRAACLLGLCVAQVLDARLRPWPGTLPATELGARSRRWLERRGLGPVAQALSGEGERADALERALLALWETESARSR